MRVPRTAGHVSADQLALVINTLDPYSVAVGEYYAERRKLKPAQILRVEIPVREHLTVAEFDDLRDRIERRFGPEFQAVAMAWHMPFAVECNSITGALTMGYDAGLCGKTCGPSLPSPYFNSPTSQPKRDLNMRLSMLLAAASVEQARAMIDRGVASDGTLGLRGAPPVQVLLTTSHDKARDVRAALYPAAGALPRSGVNVSVLPIEQLAARDRVLLMQAGVARLPALDSVGFVPGALADHLTSYGGALHRRHGQSTVLDWIQAGATASYGNVTEPCNHLQKFPHPQVLLLHYLQGESAIEAYWRSVLWPQQGLFVGEPLAAPFARQH